MVSACQRALRSRWRFTLPRVMTQKSFLLNLVQNGSWFFFPSLGPDLRKPNGFGGLGVFAVEHQQNHAANQRDPAQDWR
jgi:hypothetical protein